MNNLLDYTRRHRLPEPHVCGQFYYNKCNSKSICKITIRVGHIGVTRVDYAELKDLVEKAASEILNVIMIPRILFTLKHASEINSEQKLIDDDGPWYGWPK